MKKAELKYENGWVAVLPKTENFPMLLLEWVSEYRVGKMPLFKVIDGDEFKVRLNLTKVEYLDLINYLNKNN